MTPRETMLERLDQLREAVEADRVEMLAIVAVGEAMTVSISGTMLPVPVANGAALALIAHIHQLVENAEEGEAIDLLVTAEDDDEETEGGGLN